MTGLGGAAGRGGSTSRWCSLVGRAREERGRQQRWWVSCPNWRAAAACLVHMGLCQVYWGWGIGEGQMQNNRRQTGQWSLRPEGGDDRKQVLCKFWLAPPKGVWGVWGAVLPTAHTEQKQWGSRGAAARHALSAAHQAGSAGFGFAEG